MGLPPLTNLLPQLPTCHPSSPCSLTDHTQLDWRPLLPQICIPCLNCCGAQSGVFPLEGCESLQTAMHNCCNVVFQSANHWLYLEQPQEFNSLILDFVEKGNEGRAARTLIP